MSLWVCDPMHGNTIKSASGYKTRPFDRSARGARVLRRPQAEGTIPGGVHFEMTGKDVTECTGGVRAVTDENLSDPLPHRLRPAPERQPGAGTGLPGGRGGARTAKGRRRIRAACSWTREATFVMSVMERSSPAGTTWPVPPSGRGTIGG
jgi:hypothetical protein